MGYLHITNLYSDPSLLQCYALEKIHGSSAHVVVKGGEVHLHAGGVSGVQFAKLFDKDALLAAFRAKFTADQELFIYGEVFGGKLQRMSPTYGTELRFLAFDVKLDGVWLRVPSAEALAAEFGIGFVPYELGPLTLEWLDAQRDRDSRVAIVPGKIAEGIVVRPVHELQGVDGRRIIFKHKRAEFRETATQHEVDLDPEKAAALEDAKAIADEWVTPMRLEHVLQKTPFRDPKDTKAVIDAMKEDVEREAGDAIVWSQAVAKAVSSATVKLLHRVDRSAVVDH